MWTSLFIKNTASYFNSCFKHYISDRIDVNIDNLLMIRVWFYEEFHNTKGTSKVSADISNQLSSNLYWGIFLLAWMGCDISLNKMYHHVFKRLKVHCLFTYVYFMQLAGIAFIHWYINQADNKIRLPLFSTFQ